MNRHLNELRARIIQCAVAYVVVVGVCFYYANDLYGALASLISLPLISTKITAPFMVPLQLAMFCALLICMPYILYNIWAFIKPALRQHERKSIVPWLLFSCALFYIGIAFALLVMAPLAIGFFETCAPPNITVLLDIGNYLDFVLTLAFGSAAAFQIPIVTLFLLRSGIVSRTRLSAMRPYVILLAFILGMILTPPDVVSQVLLALPMWGLFEIGLVIDKLVARRISTSLVDQHPPSNVLAD